MNTPPPIDIHKVREGDRTAFHHFFTTLYPRLMALACRFVDEDTANDIVQDVFATYWERRQRIEAEHIHSFLFKWVQNNCLNHLKHRLVVEDHHARVRLAHARIQFLDHTSDDNETFTRLTSRNLMEIVENAITRLPPHCARAFRLCYFEDMTHREIARTMHIPHRTVERYIHQSIHFLRHELQHILTIIIL
jgi:RNA polymerase sigma-70 factor (ECF subfamily)